MPDLLDTHYTTMLEAIIDGAVVPFFGAGVNLCGRPKEEAWSLGQAKYLPSGGELAQYLANKYQYPLRQVQGLCPSCELEISIPEETQDLARVSQYVAIMSGTGPLYNKLHVLFDADYDPTPVHNFFASLPATLRDKGYRHPYQLIVTTNYDDVLERAFLKANEPYDLVCYVAGSGQSGKFVHQPFGDKERLIEKPNEYHELPITMDGHKAVVERTLIFKLHGAINRVDAMRDCYVITEDDYIDYLARADFVKPLPAMLEAKLSRSHILFLGYGLRDWNLRVILDRIWKERKLTWVSWAIQLGTPDPVDEASWSKRNVVIYRVPLDEYVALLDKRMRELPHTGRAP